MCHFVEWVRRGAFRAAAILAVAAIMQLAGIWALPAETAVKAYFALAGVFLAVAAILFAHAMDRRDRD